MNRYDTTGSNVCTVNSISACTGHAKCDLLIYPSMSRKCLFASELQARHVVWFSLNFATCPHLKCFSNFSIKAYFFYCQVHKAIQINYSTKMDLKYLCLCWNLRTVIMKFLSFYRCRFVARQKLLF